MRYAHDIVIVVNTLSLYLITQYEIMGHFIPAILNHNNVEVTEIEYHLNNKFSTLNYFFCQSYT